MYILSWISVEVKYFLAWPLCFSSESLTHFTNGNHEKPSVPQEAGKHACHDMILSREYFHSSSFTLVSQKMKKHNGKSVSKSAEKTFHYLKGFSATVLFETHQRIRFSSVWWVSWSSYLKALKDIWQMLSAHQMCRKAPGVWQQLKHCQDTRFGLRELPSWETRGPEAY